MGGSAGGLEAFQKFFAALRAESRDGRPLLLAMTGFGQPGDRERSFAAGFDRHMTKPPDVDLLRRLIDGIQAPGED
jgi:CheY-like chemotaxis protein